MSRVQVPSLTPSRRAGPWRHLATGVALSFALGAVLVTSVISAAPASAHAALVKITPDADAQLTTAPTEVVLEFDEPVSATFATVVVTTAAGVTVARGKPTVLGAKVTQALSPTMASGGYRIAFRVVSNDGHPVSGQSRFTLTSPSGTTPAMVGGTPAAATVTPSRPPPRLARWRGLTTPTRSLAGWIPRSFFRYLCAFGAVAPGGCFCRQGAPPPRGGGWLGCLFPMPAGGAFFFAVGGAAPRGF